jgi:hypothetical protein
VTASPCAKVSIGPILGAVGTGLSKEQRQVLTHLCASRRQLTSGELLDLLEREATDSSTRSMIRTLRRLERRGLVRLERLPGRGQGLIAAAAVEGAEGELYGADLARLRAEGGR